MEVRKPDPLPGRLLVRVAMAGVRVQGLLHLPLLRLRKLLQVCGLN